MLRYRPASRRRQTVSNLRRGGQEGRTVVPEDSDGFPGKDEVTVALADGSRGLERSAPQRPLSNALAGLAPSPWWARPMRGLLLMLVDLVALGSAWGAAYWIWGWGLLRQDPHIYVGVAPVLGLFLLSYLQAGLYPGFGIGSVELLRRITLRTSLVFVLITAVTYWLKLPHQYSRVTVVLAWLGALVTLPLARFAFVHLVGRTHWWSEPSVVITRGSSARKLFDTLKDSVSIGYRPVAVLVMDRANPHTLPEARSVLGCLEDAPALAARGLRVALLQSDGSAGVGKVLDFLRQHFRHVILFPGTDEAPVDGAEVRDLAGNLGIEFTSQLLRRRNRIVKRAIDIVAGSVGLVVAAPLIGAAALAVKAASRGSAFFGQDRVGFRGRRIRVWKIRTMHLDAEARLERHLAGDELARREWETRFKLRRDPRIVPGIGGLLRRFSLDELPQLLNVLRGDMSLVGPRPFPDYHLQKFTPAFREFRSQVRPGLTGLWQVMVRSDGGLDEQQALDSHYIRNWSLWLDLYVIMRTSLAVIVGKGAR